VDPDEEGLGAEATGLAHLASALIGIRGDNTRETSEKASRDLGRATIRFSIALENLAAAATTAADAMEARFDRPAEPVDPLATERAELALLSAILAGDFALDSFAWAELVRRKATLGRDLHGKLAVPWSTFMDQIDADPSDEMIRPARFLDVTLDAARDALVAHRDPELWPMWGSGTGGWFSLDLVTLDDVRVRRALDALEQITLPAPFGPPVARISSRSEYSSIVDHLVGASLVLDRNARLLLRSAYRWGGFSSPSLATIASHYGHLVRLYLARRGVTGF
jgi:hypothetical protein